MEQILRFWLSVINCSEKKTRMAIVMSFQNFQTFIKYRKQPSRGVPMKRCSENMQQIYRRTPNLIEITLQYGCYPVSLLPILRTPFHWNISGGLLPSGVPVMFVNSVGYRSFTISSCVLYGCG